MRQTPLDPSQDIALRTGQFASAIMSMADDLPRSRSVDVIIRQIVRSATSTGANYREARRARSRAEFISKIFIALQELEETRYWLELVDSRDLADVTALLQECDQLLRLLNSSATTARKNARRRRGD